MVLWRVLLLLLWRRSLVLHSTVLITSSLATLAPCSMYSGRGNTGHPHSQIFEVPICKQARKRAGHVKLLYAERYGGKGRRAALLFCTNLWPVLGRRRAALVRVVLRGRGVVVRVGLRRRRGCVEGCGLVPAAKLLRRRLVLQQGRASQPLLSL